MNWPAIYEDVFAKLRGVEGGRAGLMRWVAQCPSHEDDRASLTLAIGGRGQLIMRCHAPHGCNTESILKAIGLKWDAVFPDKRTHQMSRSFKTAYDYRDEQGKLLYQCCRMEPKSFYQRRPNPNFVAGTAISQENPEWINNLDGVRLVPYLLPQLLKAIQERPNRLILVCEGEKDCDLASRFGMVATCNPMGSLKWKPEFSAFLKGCNVVVIPDEDPVDPNVGFSPGIRHAEEVCASLVGVAASVKMLRLPGQGAKQDLSDWWWRTAKENKDEATIKAELAKLIKESPERAPQEAPKPVQETPAPAPVAAPAAAPQNPPQTAAGVGEPPVGAPAGAFATGRVGEAPTYEPTPEKPAPAPVAATPVTTPTGELAEILETVDRWRKSSNAPVRSLSEWYGMVRGCVTRMDNALANDDTPRTTVRNLALSLASTLVMGVVELKELKA